MVDMWEAMKITALGDAGWFLTGLGLYFIYWAFFKKRRS